MSTIAAPRSTLRVQRWTRTSAIASGVLVALVAALALVPMLLDADTIEKLTTLLILVILAVMWNALAGYGGLVSVGQQAFIGFGAYGTIFLTQRGVPAYLAMGLAAAAAGVLALPVSLLVLRLRGGQFAIGTWVVAEVFLLLATIDQELGGGTGTSLRTLNVYGRDDRRAYTYWLALAVAALALALIFVLLRSRLGAALQAIRDDEEAASSLGVRVLFGKRVLFVIAAVGCAAAGGLILASTLFIEPKSIFGVQWSAYMIFMVLVGGLGTFEGPIIGAVVFFLIQNQFADGGAWYLVGLGATAIVFALFLPRGIWGTIEQRYQLRLLPVGYRLQRTAAHAAVARPPSESDNDPLRSSP